MSGDGGSCTCAAGSWEWLRNGEHHQEIEQGGFYGWFMIAKLVNITNSTIVYGDIHWTRIAKGLYRPYTSNWETTTETTMKFTAKHPQRKPWFSREFPTWLGSFRRVLILGGHGINMLYLLYWSKYGFQTHQTPGPMGKPWWIETIWRMAGFLEYISSHQRRHVFSDFR